MLSSASGADVAMRQSGHRAERNSLWLWLIVAVGAVLRLIALGHKSFWIDEIASVAIARRAGPVFWHFLWHDEGNMGAYYILLRPWLRLGYAEGTVRLLSVLPGVLSIPLMFALGRRLFSRKIGVIAAAFFALNACAISVSQEARAYSFVVLLVLLSTYLFVQLIELPTRGVAFAYAVVAGLTCYFHYFGVLVPAAHFAVLVGLPARRRPWRMLVPAAAVTVVVVAPILWLIHVQDTGHISWVQAPSFLELYHLGAFLAADSGKAVGGVLLALDLVLAGVFLKRFQRVWSSDVEGRWRYLLVASLVATPILLTLLVSMLRPAFYHRFLIICLPGWVLMTAAGAEELRRRSWRAAAVAGVCVLSLVSAGIVYRRVQEDWRGAVNYLIANSRPDDRVLYYKSVGEFAGESYRDWLAGGDARRPTPVAVGGPTEWDAGDSRRVWLVLYRVKPNDAAVGEIEQELGKRYVVGASEEFRGVTVVSYATSR